jgi:hypothetical protein
MALIKCMECEKDISDKSKFCPHCGFTFPGQSSQENKVEFDNEEIIEVKAISANEKEKESISFWSYPSAKILLALVIVSLCLSMFSVYLSQRSPDLEQDVDSLNHLVDALYESIGPLSRDVDTLFDNVNLIKVGITSSEGIVTDTLVVQKAVLNTTKPGELTGFIDIRPQTSEEYLFLGRGKFDLTDKELRIMLKELIVEVVSIVESQMSNHTLKKIYITANNYDVAEYENGIITLAGE